MQPFILTGLPRSGTSIVSARICTHIVDAYCFNEIFYHLPTLDSHLQRMGKRLRERQPVPNKYSYDGLTTNVDSPQSKELRMVDQDFTAEIWVGSKVTTKYLNSLEWLAERFPILILIRNPVYQIASWRSPWCIDLNMNRCAGDDFLARYWGRVDFQTDDLLTRQAEIWQWYLERIQQANVEYNSIHVLKYEDLGMNAIAGWMGKDAQDFSFGNYNTKDRYPVEWDTIEKAVATYCPLRTAYGYGE